ncbi:MAG: 6-bladed beta-propeller [Gemmatimonadetes bacterium]|nr:6-bladed beta-propeller [Gemmatimonadota bacterium]
METTVDWFREIWGMTARIPTVLATAATFTFGACATDTDSSADGPDVVTETIGDTTVVRTLSGSVWEGDATLVPEVSIGELDGPEEYLFGRIFSIAADDDRNVYVFDHQAQEVRVFDPEGTYVETLGGRGEGPGEFSRAEAIALLPDGRLVVRDPGNQRIEVFGPASGQSDQWGYRAGGLYTGSPLYTDVNGRTFVYAPDRSDDDRGTHLIVFGPDGTQVDTLPYPSSTHEPPMLTAERRGVTASGQPTRGSTATHLPFSPMFQWTVHPSGHFLTGLSARYRIDLARDDDVLRIERAADPVRVHDEERDHKRDGVVEDMRDMDPDWSWNGPPIPEHKPFFNQLLAGRNGRIWVRLATEGQPVENEYYDPEDPGSMPIVWSESVRYDVFETDGVYLGAVVPPDEFSPYPNPVFDGDHVWGVTRDELGVQRVVRFRIVVGG